MDISCNSRDQINWHAHTFEDELWTCIGALDKGATDGSLGSQGYNSQGVHGVQGDGAHGVQGDGAQELQGGNLNQNSDAAQDFSRL
uniref:Uncharacterized protein n=1 Tax=Oryza sativa subsp. japonica TaxID=39947 RepID=Q6Z672_ORYSJ|nr:hypothetical protein [Oryza sativa Japonica Group]BAD12998.1 hypothetical protein [Oryza sativa Japonica Group]